MILAASSEVSGLSLAASANLPCGLVRAGDFLAQGFDDFVEAGADGRVRDAGLLGHLLEVAASEDEDLDEPLMLAGEIHQPRAGKTSVDGNVTAMTAHAADGHRFVAVRAKVGGGHFSATRFCLCTMSLRLN